MPSGGGAISDYASWAGLIVQGGFAVLVWYFVTKYIPRIEAAYRDDVKAFLQALEEQRKAHSLEIQAFMQSLTALREDSYKMRQEDRAATAKFFETMMTELLERRDKADKLRRDGGVTEGGS